MCEIWDLFWCLECWHWYVIPSTDWVKCFSQKRTVPTTIWIVSRPKHQTCFPGVRYVKFQVHVHRDASRLDLGQCRGFHFPKSCEGYLNMFADGYSLCLETCRNKHLTNWGRLEETQCFLVSGRRTDWGWSHWKAIKLNLWACTI